MIGIYQPVSITFVTINMVSTIQNIISSNNIFSHYIVHLLYYAYFVTIVKVHDECNTTDVLNVF